MISLVVGKPGAGKTLLLVKEHIIPAAEGVEAIQGRAGIGARKGVAQRHVITNVPVQTLRIESGYPRARGYVHYVEVIDGDLRPFADPDKLTAWSEQYVNEDGLGPLFVIDEAHMSFARGQVTKALLEWLTLHRHHGVDIILATQQVGQIDRNVSGLSEVYIVLKRNRALGLGNNKYRLWVYDGYPKGALIKGTSNNKHDPRFFKFYRSRFSEALAEYDGGGGWPFFLRLPFLAAYLFFGVMAAFMVWAFVPPPSDPAAVQVAVPDAVVPVVSARPALADMSVPVPVSRPDLVPVLAPGELPAQSPQFSDLLSGILDPAAPGVSELLPVLPEEQPSIQRPSWTIHGWVAFVKDGRWTCEARFTDASGNQVKPWAMKARLRWKSISTEWDAAAGVCTLTIDEGIDGKEPIVDASEIA